MKISQRPLIKRCSRRSKKYLCSDTFEPELKRIFRKNSICVTKGIPVHYLIQSDNAHRLADTLVSSLYSNNRLGCARYTVLDLYNLSARSSDIRELFRVCSGSTIIMNCCGLKCTNSDNCTADETIPDILFEFINVYKTRYSLFLPFQMTDLLSLTLWKKSSVLSHS